MTHKWKMIQDPQEGELVTFLGVHALRWRPEWGEPTVAFVDEEVNDDARELLENLVRHCDNSKVWEAMTGTGIMHLEKAKQYLGMGI